MAYPKSRSCVSELQHGVSEGTYSYQGKDWGGVPGGVRYRDCGCPEDCGCGCSFGDCSCEHPERAHVDLPR